jgi:putative transposase
MKLLSPLAYLSKFLKGLLFSDGEGYKYRAEEYAKLILSAAKGQDYVETVSQAMKELPDADTLFLRLQGNASIAEIEEQFKAYVTHLLERLKATPKAWLPRKPILALDETHLPYYGRKPNIWVHGYKPVKGSTGCYKFMVVSMVACSRKLVLFALPIPKIQKPKECYVEELLAFACSQLNVGMVLLDRGFYDLRVMRYLGGKGLRFILLVPRYEAYKGIMARGNGLYDYTMAQPKKGTKVEVRFYFVVVLDYLGYDWLFATNTRLDDLQAYVHLYKRRWGIETAFRVQDEAGIKSKSRLMEVRYFLFTVESMLYNLWAFSGTGVSFSVFVLTSYLKALVELVVDAVLEALGVEVKDKPRVVSAAARRLGAQPTW